MDLPPLPARRGAAHWARASSLRRPYIQADNSLVFPEEGPRPPRQPAVLHVSPRAPLPAPLLTACVCAPLSQSQPIAATNLGPEQCAEVVRLRRPSSALAPRMGTRPSPPTYHHPLRRSPLPPTRPSQSTHNLPARPIIPPPSVRTSLLQPCLRTRARPYDFPDVVPQYGSRGPGTGQCIHFGNL